MLKLKNIEELKLKKIEYFIALSGICNKVPAKVHELILMIVSNYQSIILIIDGVIAKWHKTFNIKSKNIFIIFSNKELNIHPKQVILKTIYFRYNIVGGKYVILQARLNDIYCSGIY